MIISKSFSLKLILLTVLLLTVVAGGNAPAYAAPILDIRQVDISAEILSSGSMRVIEKRTIHFYNLSRGATIFFSTVDELQSTLQTDR